MRGLIVVAAGMMVLGRAAGPARAQDEFEPDNTLAAAQEITNGVTQVRSIHVAGDTDWVKFRVTGSGAENVRLETAGSGYGDTVVWLYKGSGGLVASDDDSGLGKYSLATADYLAPGTYYIKVQEYGHDAPIPSYMLQVEWTTVVIAADRYERDDTMRTSKLIANGQIQSRTIHRPGNVDWAKIRIGGDGAANLKVETSGTGGDTQMWLYQTDGTRLAYNNNSGVGNFSKIQVESLPRGTYLVKIQEYGNDHPIAAYALKATWTETNRMWPAEIDGPITWLHTDVTEWPVTASMTASVGDGKIRFPYDKANVWPGISAVGATVNANPWVIVKWTDGRWYAATFEWLRPGQTSKPMGVLDGSLGDHIKVAPLNRWRPRSGERFGILVSGLARSTQRNVQERSNVSMVTWP